MLALLSRTATALPSPPSPASSSFPPQTFLAALNQADLPASQVLWSGVRRVPGSVGWLQGCRNKFSRLI